MIAVIASQVGLLLGLLALGLVTLSLARQIGVLHERTAPVGGLLQKARREAAKVDRIDLDAVGVATAAGFSGPLRALSQGRAIALLFVNEGCAVCKSLLPSYAAALRHCHAVPLVLVGGAVNSLDGGSGPSHTSASALEEVATVDAPHRLVGTDLDRFANRHGLRPDQVLASTELAVALQVMQTPTLALLDPQGRLLERVRLRGPAHMNQVAARLAEAA